MEYAVTLHRLFSSPAHHYFTRPKFERGGAPTYEHQEILLQAAKGISGDRFEHGRYPLTFFSLEVAQLMEESMGRSIDVRDFRRNIIISGINLCELIGKHFTIGDVTFEGIAHCNPCTWMNAVIGEGAYALMKGRGGLRARVIDGGRLALGSQTLCSETPLFKTAITPLTTIRLP